jgi:hypothetical protein
MGKSMKKSKQSAQRKNTALNQVVLKEEDVLFGRAVKKLGNGMFSILTTDSDNHSIEVKAAIASKSVVRIMEGDIIIVGCNESAKHTTYEILGSVDKKTTQKLREANRLHKSFFTETDQLDDDLFDRSEDAVEEEDGSKPKMEKGNKPVKKEKMLAEGGDDDEVDIDGI